jgi:hypothetical protein
VDRQPPAAPPLVRHELIIAALVSAGTLTPALAQVSVPLWDQKLRWSLIDAVRARQPLALRTSLLMQVYRNSGHPLIDAELYLLTRAMLTDDRLLFRAVETIIATHRPPLPKGP